MERYHTSGILNRDLLWKARDYLFLVRRSTPRYRILTVFTRVFGVVCLFFALIALIAHDVPSAVFLVAAFLLFFLLPTKGRSLAERLRVSWDLRRLSKYQPQHLPQYEYESFLDDEGLTYRNYLTNVGESVPYSRFCRVAETEDIFLLVFRTGDPVKRFVPVFKSGLTREEQESFLPFLLERCPKIKVMK